MIAEVNGKISRTGSNLSDRLEDKLTGDVFGSLRYLPFQEGIAPILCAARVPELSAMLEHCGLVEWANCISFWPYDQEGELDALIQTEELVIGIEVKYRSGLSSDDGIENMGNDEEENDEESCNQLARESRILRSRAGTTRLPVLIFIAEDASCSSVCRDVLRRNILAQGVRLGFISWQEILQVLERQKNQDPFRACILQDVIALLKRKGFERFSGFEPLDDIQVCADVFFSYAYQEKKELSFLIEPEIDGGSYYEYG